MQMTLCRTWADIGGADLWYASWYPPHDRWYTGWHTPRPMAYWHCTTPKEGQLIGWELWADGHTLESYYISLNPGLDPDYDRAAPKTGLQWSSYDAHGSVVALASLQ